MCCMLASGFHVTPNLSAAVTNVEEVGVSRAVADS